MVAEGQHKKTITELPEKHPLVRLTAVPGECENTEWESLEEQTALYTKDPFCG